MTSPFLERSIRGRWPRAGVALALCIAPLAAQATDDSLARLKSGVESLKKGELDQALSQISGVQSKLPQVADYITFWIAQIQAQKKNHSAVAPALEPVWKSTPVSPLAGRASVLAAKSLIELESFQDAMNALARAPKETLPQPQAGALQAKAQEGLGDAITAALSWRDVYFGYPLSDEATEAKTALSRLEKELGERYPQPSAQARLDRAQKLLDGRQAAKARDEYEEMIPLLAGAERELAQVGVAAADLKAKRNEIAVAYLKNLRPQTQEAQARRLYFLVSGLRRLNRDSEAMDALEEMSQVAPASPWRLKAIVQSAGNYLVDNDAQHFLPLYAVCASQFPNTPEAANCDWRIAWQAYLQRDSEAARQLRAHLTRFPSSEKAGAALYYLGRLAQESGDYAAARRYWAELQTRFPNYYYTVVVRPRAQAPEVARAGPSPQTDAFLASVRFPERVRKADFTVDAASARRVNRAQLLRRAGLEEWAEGELRFAVRNGANPYPLALELSETAEQRGAPGVALRYVKGTVPGYLALARDGAPPKFWRAAFPFPYRSLVNRYSVEQSLDPFLVAALIRQESEFDTEAVSASKAVGLTQVLPSTGKDLSRRLKIPGYRSSMLTNPDVNLKLGTYYLRKQLDARDGSVEETLAGYNAGPSRVTQWRTWGEFREPSEFVETIPFTETRDYVQIILRNADMYRWLYSGENLAVDEGTPPKKSGKSSTSGAKKKSNAKRKK